MAKLKKRLRNLLQWSPHGPRGSTTPGAQPLGLFVSFPKSGRTWLRVMLDYLEIPMEYWHADSQHQKAVRFDKLKIKPAKYAGWKVVLLLRDPRDVVVSGYFQATKRQKNAYEADISQFIRDPCHGIEKIIHFNNLWLEATATIPNMLVTRYENCHTDTLTELKRIATLVGRSDTPDEKLEAAVEFGRFENMRQRETMGEFEEKYGAALTPTEPTDSESYKTRRGKVGGFADYLSAADLQYCQDVMKRLNSEYLSLAVDQKRHASH